MKTTVQHKNGSAGILEPQRYAQAIGETMKPIQRTAKIAGALYLLIAVLSGFVHFYVPGALIVPGDATATASNIMASEGLLRLSIGSELIILLSEVALSVLLYVLLRPVNRTLSLIAAASRLVMTTIHGFNVVNQVVVLLLVSGAGYLTVFQPDQVHALVMLFSGAYSAGFQIGIVFLILHALPLGYLIYRSGYFPKVLGVLFMIASVGYLIDSASYILIANYTPGPVYLAIPIAISEIAFPLWLLFRGVNAERWRLAERADVQRQDALTTATGRPALAAV